MANDDWAPASCTLPSAQRPLRVAEFDHLFQQALISAARLDATHLRLVLSGGGGTADRARDLTARETECCSFFDFDVVEADGTVVITIAVPVGHVAVLDSLAGRALEVAG